jgi:predicted nucleic acid-binding protein
MLRREPFAIPAAKLLSRVEAGEISGCLCATTVTTIHYLAAKVLGRAGALAEVRKLFALFEIAPVNRPVLAAALEGGFPDFEDAVLYEAARQLGAWGIVTRDPAGFEDAEIPVHSPQEILRILDLRQPDRR